MKWALQPPKTNLGNVIKVILNWVLDFGIYKKKELQRGKEEGSFRDIWFAFFNKKKYNTKSLEYHLPPSTLASLCRSDLISCSLMDKPAARIHDLINVGYFECHSQKNQIWLYFADQLRLLCTHFLPSFAFLWRDAAVRDSQRFDSFSKELHKPKIPPGFLVSITGSESQKGPAFIFLMGSKKALKVCNRKDSEKKWRGPSHNSVYRKQSARDFWSSATCW